jgi:hypothetical protein
MSRKVLILVAGTALAAVFAGMEADRRCSAAQGERGFCAIVRTPQPAPEIGVSPAPTAPRPPLSTIDRYPAARVVAANPGATPPRGVPIHPGELFQTKVEAAPPGTVFIVKAGTHRRQRVTPKSGQSFIGEPGAVMNGARLLSQWLGSGPWYVTGQPRSMPSNSSRRCQSGYPRCDIPHDLYINNVVKRHVASLSEVNASSWFYDYSAGRIYIGENPGGKIVEVTETAAAFTGLASGVVIRGLVIEKYANRAQASPIGGSTGVGPDWTVENNVFQFNHGIGLRTAHRMKVRGNQIIRNGQLGIGGGGDDVLVEGNEIAHNNTLGYGGGWENGGSKFVRTNRLVVRNNFVHHNVGAGLWTDIDNYHTTYEDNRVEDNSGPGIFHEISFDAVIRRNTLRRNGFGAGNPFSGGTAIKIASSENVTIHDNLLENNKAGISGINEPRDNENGRSYRLRNLNVYRNTIRVGNHAVADNWTGIAGVRHPEDPFTQSNNRFHQNTYYVPNDRAYWAWEGGQRTWTTWQGYGQDLNGKASR